MNYISNKYDVTEIIPVTSRKNDSYGQELRKLMDKVQDVMIEKGKELFIGKKWGEVWGQN